MKKSKIVSLTLAGTLTATVLLAGTYAWQSISQQATNEVVGEVNPGGRLHDDFNGVNKDVYVENFTSREEDGATIYARIKLTEYLEMGSGAGQPAGTGKTAVSIMGTEEGDPVFDKKETWTTYTYNNPNDIFRNYFTWDMGGETDYMPTYNKNKDSLEADINGTLAGDETGPYGDYDEYTTGDTKTGIEIYDADEDTTEEKLSDEIWALLDRDGNGTLDITADTGLDTDSNGTNDITITVSTDTDGNTVAEINLNAEATDDDGTDIKVVGHPTHEAKDTLNATIMSMTEWIANGCQEGPYWVYDTDGWAYWADGIEPGTATGCLLNGIERKASLVSEYYYAINVVAQFATAGDWGEPADTENGKAATGFYADSITNDALYLLNTIAGGEKNIIITTEDYDVAAGVTPGETLQLNADVMLGGITLNDTVEWSITSVTSSNDTMINPITGKLTVGADETAEYIVATATLKDNEKITLNYTVKVGSVYTMTVSTTDGGDYVVFENINSKTLTATVVDQRGKVNTGEVTWNLEGTYVEGTGIDEDGVLTVSDNETAEKIIVVASLDVDGTVTVTDTYDVKVVSQIEYIATYMTAGTTDTVTIDGIEWYVLRKNEKDSQALLWTVDGVTHKPFNFEDSSLKNKWEGSNVQTYLNSEGEYENAGFLEEVPTLMDLIEPTEITTRIFGSTDGDLETNADTHITTNDKVFLFSEADIFQTYNGKTEDVMDDDYTIKDENGKGIKILENNMAEKNILVSTTGTWLRSPGSVSVGVMILDKGGSCMVHNRVNYNALRPALWINLTVE